MGALSSKLRDTSHRSREYVSTTTPSTSRYSAYPESHEKPQARERLKMKYSRIGDDYNSLEQVTEDLSNAGLESSNLIVGIDFTKSNEWAGKVSFNRRSLHDMDCSPNPYEQAISVIGRTLSAFDEDNLIPCFGFGDATTHDQEVFSFFPNNRPCNGFEEALERYREIVPHLRLAGPTSFAPIIETAISIVDQTGGQYHVLLIIADGQVTSGVGKNSGKLSSQERDTINAIVKASDYPLSIVLVGVGDGPWDMMQQFDDNIPSRSFDNFQFVNSTEIMSKNIANNKKEAEFALSALMEIPSQYKATLDLQLLGKRRGIPRRKCLPPPIKGRGPTSKRPQSSISDPSPGVDKSNAVVSSASAVNDKKICGVCSNQTKNLAFGCGHQVCYDCGNDMKLCPICSSPINTRIRLY
ncbi:E3 ubiquitin-protein ligase RGLG2-like [Zingiber officinale]|uniref:E3 ubiquitin-protein ligase RGLG2-like n=1 Tax=Zingiber officinale TaxID=94328 RepID=UPI001C4C1F37|nr:E3 ubiquitin-protein ligase RGLG2-like [Zingiber officinale]